MVAGQSSARWRVEHGATGVGGGRDAVDQAGHESEMLAPEVESLLEATALIDGSVDPTTTLESVLEVILRLTGADLASIRVVESDGTHLDRLAIRGSGCLTDNSAEYRFRIGEGLAGIVAQSGEAQTLGVAAFVSKPVTIEALAKAVREVLDRAAKADADGRRET